MSSVAYHLSELEIVRDPSNPRRAVPTVEVDERRVLDVGCGIGQTLLAPEFHGVAERCGIDPDVEAVTYGKKEFPFLDLRVASAESIPFPDDCFDLVFSRVALPYSNIPRALVEIRRVLRPGGRLWVMMHSWHIEKSRFQRGIALRSLKQIIDSTYVAMNSALVNVLGVSVARPWSGKHESFQTRRGAVRLLAGAGFDHVRYPCADWFAMICRKPSLPTGPRQAK